MDDWLGLPNISDATTKNDVSTTGNPGKKESIHVTADFTYTDCMAGKTLKTSTENKRKFLNA